MFSFATKSWNTFDSCFLFSVRNVLGFPFLWPLSEAWQWRNSHVVFQWLSSPSLSVRQSGRVEPVHLWWDGCPIFLPLRHGTCPKSPWKQACSTFVCPIFALETERQARGCHARCGKTSWIIDETIVQSPKQGVCYTLRHGTINAKRKKSSIQVSFFEIVHLETCWVNPWRDNL